MHANNNVAHDFGTFAQMPDPNHVPIGDTYFATDQLTLYVCELFIGGAGNTWYPAGGVTGLAGKTTIPLGSATHDVTVPGMTAASIVLVALMGPFDATLTRITATPGSGKFTVTGNTTATAAVAVAYAIIAL